MTGISDTYSSFRPQANGAYAKNLVVYGPKATGKSDTTKALLNKLAADGGDGPAAVRHAIVSSARCISGRHLFETTLSAVAEALGVEDAPKRCENMAQLASELSKMLSYRPDGESWRFVLVFDGIGAQREAPPTLLPGLSRLSEIVSCLSSPTSPEHNDIYPIAAHLLTICLDTL